MDATTARTTRTTASSPTPISTEPQSLSVRDILVESSNVGTIYVSRAMGYERQYHYLHDVRSGSGDVSDLGFPGESPGILKDWHALGGHRALHRGLRPGSLAPPPCRLVTAVNVIANDGTYVAPRLMTGTVGADGEITDVAAVGDASGGEPGDGSADAVDHA